MFGLRKSRTNKVRDALKEAVSYTDELIRDERLRSDIRSAVGHGAVATHRVREASGFSGLAARLAADRELRENLRSMLDDVDSAGGRVRRKTSHRVRNALFVAGASGAALAAVPSVRRWAAKRLQVSRNVANPSGTTVEETIEVAVPVSTAYNQWTQFEEFPRFMDGVEEVRQLDDTLLHWAASVAGKRREWDAKIIEQSPDRRIAWQSVGGVDTRGSVSFEPVGPDRTRVHLAMNYRPEGIERVGAAIGLDDRRVRGDLNRFKDLIEGRGVESGAWRGEVKEGTRSS
jgi:uncharacterized membrane protein